MPSFEIAEEEEEATANLDPAKEVMAPQMAAILAVKEKVNLFLGHDLQASMTELAAKSADLQVVDSPESRETVFRAAQALQKARTKTIDPTHADCKGPATEVGRVLDERKRALTAIVKPEEDRLRGLIQQWDDEIKRLEEERLAAIQRRTNDRMQACMELGIRYDIALLQTAEDEVWQPYFEGLKDEAEKAREADRKEQERLHRIQVLVATRLEAAAKFGGVMSREEAEAMTDEAFAAKEASWKAAHEKREAQRRDDEEVASFQARAQEQGFVLSSDVVRSWGSREADFMAWLAVQVKERVERDRRDERLAQVEELGIAVPMKQVKELDDREWGELLRKLAPVPVAISPVEIAATPAILVHDEPWFGGGSSLMDEPAKRLSAPAAQPEGEWGSRLSESLSARLEAALDRAAQAEDLLVAVRSELADLVAQFNAFGHTLQAGDKDRVRPVYQAMKKLLQRLA